MVDFGENPTWGLPSQIVKLNKDQIVLGLGNAWADDSQCVFMSSKECEDFYDDQKKEDK